MNGQIIYKDKIMSTMQQYSSVVRLVYFDLKYGSKIRLFRNAQKDTYFRLLQDNILLNRIFLISLI